MGKKIKYKVHRLDINIKKEPYKLEQFLNNLDGEVVSIIPDIKPFFLCYGSKVNSVFIIEKI